MTSIRGIMTTEKVVIFLSLLASASLPSHDRNRRELSPVGHFIRDTLWPQTTDVF